MLELTAHPATRRIAIASIAIVLFAGVVAAGTKSDETDVGEGRLSTRGRAAVTAVNGARREVSGVVALHTGETVEALEGEMSIELPDGATVEGRPAADKSNDATNLKIVRPVELLAGDLLVTATDGTEVVAAGNHIRLDDASGTTNAMRISRSLAVGVSVYRGMVSLDSAGQVRAVPALRALDVSALGSPPAAPTALRIDEGDSWDRRFLGEAIDLGHTLDGYADTYTRTLGTANAGSPAYYRSLLPSLANESQFTAELLTSTPHPPGEMIIGAAIAGVGRRGSFAERWHDVFAFRDVGATWGLVAVDQGVASDVLLREVQSALNATQFPFAQGPTPTTAGPTTTTAPVSTTPPPTTTQPSGTPPTTQPPPPPPTTVAPVPPTGQPLVDGLVNDVNQLLGGLVGQPPPH